VPRQVSRSALHAKVADGGVREILLQRSPRHAAIVAVPNAVFESEKNEVRIAGIFADGARELVGRKTVRERSPGPAEVVRHVDVRRAIAYEMPIDDRVGRARVAMRCFDRRHARVFVDARHRDVAPVCAVVARERNAAVVGRGPNFARLHARGGDIENRIVRFRPRNVEPQRRTRKDLPGFDVAREIGRDHAPMHARVARAEDDVAAIIGDVAVEWRERERRFPI
jgi:hypothetical protein